MLPSNLKDGSIFQTNSNIGFKQSHLVCKKNESTHLSVKNTTMLSNILYSPLALRTVEYFLSSMTLAIGIQLAIIACSTFNSFLATSFIIGFALPVSMITISTKKNRLSHHIKSLSLEYDRCLSKFNYLTPENDQKIQAQYLELIQLKNTNQHIIELIDTFEKTEKEKHKK